MKTSLPKTTTVVTLLTLVGLASVVVIGQQQQKVRKVTRVARPNFDETDYSDVYFDNVADGLVGKRPASSAESTSIASNSANSSTGESGTPTTQFSWSAVISGPTLEDEVKSLVKKLNETLTTPVKFRTSYNDVNQTFAELSLCFAVIRQFDDEVRWKSDAANALAAMQRAVVNSRTSTDKAYAYCNQRKFELTDLIRGESFPEIEKPSDEIDWSNVIDRSPAMVRLELSDQQLKQWTADESVFQENVDKILHESELVSTIATVIAMEGMDDTEDDGYLEFCTSMGTAANETVAAVKVNDYETASLSANLMSQSCSNCHEEWR